MVEKLTDTNLQLEEDIDTLKETVADLVSVKKTIKIIQCLF